MARRLKHQQLGVWMNGRQVGYWTRAKSGEQLSYLDAWINDSQGRPLSLSLPFTPGNRPWAGERVTSYFDNLLPDNDNIRRRLAQRYQSRSLEPFDLLTVLGKDCVGAIQLLLPDEAPGDIHAIKGTALTEADVARQLRGVTSNEALGQESEDDLRLSIAGAQEKTAFLYHEGRWMLPHGSTPTSHIFKLPMGLVGGMQADMRTSVENEWLCSKIVAAYGLPIAHCDIAQFEEQKVLVVERFDRRRSGDGQWIMRLPQEDLCQATGTPPHKKYQRDGGPGFATIMNILLGSDHASADRANFFKTQLLFWLLCATDGHAKNFSIAHLPGSRYIATPLYDVLSALPIMGTGANQLPRQKAKLAMGVCGSSMHYLIERIQRYHWIMDAGLNGLGEATANALIDELLETTDGVIDSVAGMLPAGFPAEVVGPVFDGLRRQGDKLASMASIRGM